MSTHAWNVQEQQLSRNLSVSGLGDWQPRSVPTVLGSHRALVLAAMLLSPLNIMRPRHAAICKAPLPPLNLDSE
eukprot:905644-Amphidinium_carterae.1